MSEKASDEESNTILLARAFDLAWERYFTAGQREAVPKDVARRELAAFLGRGPAGLAPVDLALDSSLRPGDMLATNDGLVAYSGMRVGNEQTPEFKPAPSYPSLTPEVRARLGDTKVAPARADEAANNALPPEVSRTLLPVATVAPRPARDKRVDAD